MHQVVIEIAQINSIESLKSYGEYRAVKSRIESMFGFKLGVNGWQALYNKVRHIDVQIKLDKAQLQGCLTTKDIKFLKFKNQINNKLKVTITARSWRILEDKLTQLFNVLENVQQLTAYERFEQNKVKSFRDSSKLEGIEIQENLPKMSLNEILNKYRVAS